MTKSKLYIAGALAALFVLALMLAPAPTLAKKAKHQAKAKGAITAIDATAGTVKVHDKKSDQDVTVNVTDKTRIHKNENEHATLSDLVVGDKAHTRYDTATNNAKRIQAKTAKATSERHQSKSAGADRKHPKAGKTADAEGIVTNVDSSAQSLTIQPQKKNPVTVLVTSDTKILRDGKSATFADLTVGDRANARYNTATMNAAKVVAKSAKPPKPPKPLNVSGKVTAIDLDAQAVTIQPRKGNAVTIFVTADTKVERNDQPAALADFVAGDHAHAKYNAATFEASKLQGGSQDE